MKLCFIANTASIHTIRWIKYFSDKHEISCIGFDPILEKIPNIKFYSSYHKIQNSKLLKNITSLRWLYNIYFTFKTLKKINPKLIHSHFLSIYGLVGAFFSKKRSFIITIWGSDLLIQPKKSYIWHVLTKWILKKATIITVDGFNTYNKLLNFKIPKDKIKMIGFGIDTKKFKNKNLHKQSNLINIISLRSLKPIYNIESLIKAASIVCKKFKNIRFQIIGDGSEKKKLQKLVKTLKLNQYINFIGQIPHEKLPQKLSEADIYVSTSLSDSGLAASTGEAMACSLPVIITDNADNRKWVKDNINGFIIPNNNQELLAQKIIFFIKNPHKIKQMGKNNRQNIMEKNSYNNEMNKMNNIYQKLANANL